MFATAEICVLTQISAVIIFGLNLAEIKPNERWGWSSKERRL